MRVSITESGIELLVHKPPLTPARFIAITKGDCAAVPVAISRIG